MPLILDILHGRLFFIAAAATVGVLLLIRLDKYFHYLLAVHVARLLRSKRERAGKHILIKAHHHDAF